MEWAAISEVFSLLTSATSNFSTSQFLRDKQIRPRQMQLRQG